MPGLIANGPCAAAAEEMVLPGCCFLFFSEAMVALSKYDLGRACGRSKAPQAV